MSSREKAVFGGSEIRVDSSGAKLHGYAAKFNSLSENLGGFRERIAPGAFAKSLKTADVRLLINHEGLPLARTRSGNLTLREDSVGLYFEAQLDPNDPDVQRVMPKVKRGDLSQMSFAFTDLTEPDERWSKDADGSKLRTVREAKLWEISIVTFPAYPATSVEAAGLRQAQLERMRRLAELGKLVLADAPRSSSDMSPDERRRYLLSIEPEAKIENPQAAYEREMATRRELSRRIHQDAPRSGEYSAWKVHRYLDTLEWQLRQPKVFYNEPSSGTYSAAKIQRHLASLEWQWSQPK